MRYDRYIETVLPYQQTMLNVAMQRLHNMSDAEDAVQATLLKAWLHYDAIAGYAHLPQWLMRVVSNECIDILRKRKKEYEYISQAPKHNSYYRSYEDQLILQMDVSDILSNMDSDRRNAVILSLFYGLTRKEIAAVTGICDGTVSGRIMRGKRMMRQYCRC